MLLPNPVRKKLRLGLPAILAAQIAALLSSRLATANMLSVQIVCDRPAILQKSLQADLLDAAIIFGSGVTGEAACHVWHEPLARVCHPDQVLSAGASVPLLRWPESVTDQIAVRAFKDAEISYSTVFVADQLSLLQEALRLKMGYLCVASGAVPDGMKNAKDYFLPRLPAMHAGIYRNVDADDARLDLLIKSLARTFAPDEARAARLN